MAKMLNDWIALTKENPIEADMPIIDPHHHLWDDFPLPGLPAHYLLEDFMADIGGGHNITKTVFVECTTGYRQEGPEEMRPVGETEFANQIATLSESGRYGHAAVASGMVSFADLSLGTAVEPVLEAHIAAGCQRVRGIRHATAWDASRKSYANSPRGLMLDARFRAGFACLHKHNLSYDAWLYFTQLPELVDLARTFPETTIILDHVGGILGEKGPYADKRAEVFEIWKRGITELATCANVFVKLGGLAMPNSGFGWEKAEKPPTSKEMATTTANYYLFCIEQFGVHRCMFESNFPVDKLSCSYIVLWNSFKRITRGFSNAERVALFHDTAERVYRL